LWESCQAPRKPRPAEVEAQRKKARRVQLEIEPLDFRFYPGQTCSAASWGLVGIGVGFIDRVLSGAPSDSMIIAPVSLGEDAPAERSRRIHESSADPVVSMDSADASSPRLERDLPRTKEPSEQESRTALTGRALTSSQSTARQTDYSFIDPEVDNWAQGDPRYRVRPPVPDSGGMYGKKRMADANDASSPPRQFSSGAAPTTPVVSGQSTATPQLVLPPNRPASAQATAIVPGAASSPFTPNWAIAPGPGDGGISSPTFHLPGSINLPVVPNVNAPQPALVPGFSPSASDLPQMPQVPTTPHPSVPGVPTAPSPFEQPTNSPDRQTHRPVSPRPMGPNLLRG
jgi:hypothetical protein